MNLKQSNGFDLLMGGFISSASHEAHFNLVATLTVLWNNKVDFVIQLVSPLLGYKEIYAFMHWSTCWSRLPLTDSLNDFKYD